MGKGKRGKDSSNNFKAGQILLCSQGQQNHSDKMNRIFSLAAWKCKSDFLLALNGRTIVKVELFQINVDRKERKNWKDKIP